MKKALVLSHSLSKQQRVFTWVSLILLVLSYDAVAHLIEHFINRPKQCYIENMLIDIKTQGQSSLEIQSLSLAFFKF